jgi:hypothetical protein
MDAVSFINGIYQPVSSDDSSNRYTDDHNNSVKPTVGEQTRDFQERLRARTFARKKLLLRRCLGTLGLAALCGFILFEWARWVTKLEHPDPDRDHEVDANDDD